MSAAPYRYDLAVVGAGSAGFSAAITAAEQGARVALIGDGTIGGTCVNVGCVPSKTLIRATESVHQANAAARFSGISAHGHVESWAALIAQKDALVAALRQAKYIDLLPAYPSVSYLEGEARFTQQALRLNDAPVSARKVIIATGSRARVPAIAGIGRVDWLNSTTALELQHLPRSLLVIGGGYIGCELAQIFARAGCAVTILCRSRLLPRAEPEISAALAGYFADEGITVRSGVSYQRISQAADGVTVSFSAADGTDSTRAEKVLVCAGRAPNTQALGLAAAGIDSTGDGAIVVDEQMRASHADVYAAGDVTGRDQFVYMAAYGAKIAALNAINDAGLRYDNSVMPAVVFTDPQVASVGLSEAQARAQGIGVQTSVMPLDYVPRAIAARDTRGLVKLVADARTKRLLGAHLLAPEAADSVQTAAVAIKAGMTVTQLGEMIFPYLTTVEGLKLAAQTFDKDVTKLSCCAG